MQLVRLMLGLDLGSTVHVNHAVTLKDLKGFWDCHTENADHMKSEFVSVPQLDKYSLIKQIFQLHKSSHCLADV